MFIKTMGRKESLLLHPCFKIGTFCSGHSRETAGSGVTFLRPTKLTHPRESTITMHFMMQVAVLRRHHKGNAVGKGRQSV